MCDKRPKKACRCKKKKSLPKWTMEQEAALETAKNYPSVTLNEETLRDHPDLSGFTPEACSQKWLEIKPEEWKKIGTKRPRDSNEKGSG